MKKLCALVLSVVLAMSMTACGGGEKETQAPETTEAPTTAETTTATPETEPEPVAATEPVFEDGVAQPVFAYADVIREVVYVETDVDSDGDGKADLLQVLVQRPAPTADGMKAAAIFEARPYNAGCTDAYDLDAYNAHIVNADLKEADESTTTTKEDWAWEKPDYSGITVREAAEVGAAGDGGDVWESTDNVTAYDYWLVRGYAIVSSAGLGTLGSDGFSTCASYEETAAFAAAVKWLAGDESVKAYSDKEGGVEVKADWCNGNVAMTGQSYGGSTAFAVASLGIDGLKTIISRAGIASWYDYYRSQGTGAGGLFYPGDDCHILADYCNSREFDAEDYATIQADYEAYLQQMIVEEDALSGDYNQFWDERNYTDGTFNCSAFIVHGLNDFNVRTKQFDMMNTAFKAAGQDVQVILHQGAHMTPEMIANLDYNTILGKWLAYYLYGVENGAAEAANVLVQSNLDLSWNSYDSWEEAKETVTFNAGEGKSEFTSDLSVTSFDTKQADVEEGWIEYCSDMVYAWEQEIIQGSTKASAVYTFDIAEALHISGTPTVTVKAAADESTGILSAMLVDIAPEGMNAVVLGAYSEGVETEVVEEGGLVYGDSLENKDLIQFMQTEVNSKIITRGWMDIQNRTSIYNVDEVEEDEFYEFVIELQPMDYTVEAGHQLVLVLYSVDPEVTYWPEDVTNFTVDNSGTFVTVPVR